jgi:hypothetical protein
VHPQKYNIFFIHYHTEICDFGSDNDLVTCDWSNRNGTILRWDTGAGSLSNWLGGPARDASTSDDAERGNLLLEFGSSTHVNYKIDNF